MNKIKFIRRYNFYGIEVADIIYKSGRVRTCTAAELPFTAQAFIFKANKTEQQDKYHGAESIYSME